MINENADKKDQNCGNDDDDDQGVAAENECKNSVNVLHYSISLSFDNEEGKSEEEKIMIKNVIENAEHQEVNGFKKVNRN